MDGYQFILAVLHILIWPSVVIWIYLRFESQMKEMTKEMWLIEQDRGRIRYSTIDPTCR